MLSEKVLIQVRQIEVEAFLSRGMLLRYASDAILQKNAVTGRCLFEHLEPYSPLVDGHFRLIDEWFASPFTDNIAGNTTVYFKNSPIWTMQYLGWYPEEAHEILEESLKQSYAGSSKMFKGCRGVDGVHNQTLVYYNRAYGCFADFHGTEHIVDYVNQDTLGSVTYQGRWLAN